MKISREQEYINCVTRALGGYQLVEELLKRHISVSFEFFHYKLGKSIPFKFSGKDYESSSLERLISVFEKLSDNSALTKKLNKLKGERNYVAHQSLIIFLGEERSESENKSSLAEMDEKANRAWACADEIRS